MIVCAWSSLSQRVEAINTQTLGGDVSTAQQVHGREAAEEALLRAAHLAGEYGAKVSAALLVDGEPAAALLQTAGTHDADLIVIGAIRDTSIADRFLGNVATEVVKKATCEVLVIRPTDAGDGGGGLVVDLTHSVRAACPSAFGSVGRTASPPKSPRESSPVKSQDRIALSGRSWRTRRPTLARRGRP